MNLGYRNHIDFQGFESLIHLLQDFLISKSTLEKYFLPNVLIIELANLHNEQHDPFL